ncbi:MAG: PilZ domain-containing protein [Candidatus Aminicenantaceae bacterium]
MTDFKGDGAERRQYPRVKAEVFYREPRLAPRKQAIHDISLGGVQIHCDEELEKDQQLEMEFFLPNGEVLVAIAQVRWSSKLPEGSDAAYAAGLQFMHLNPEDAEELKKYLEDIQ